MVELREAVTVHRTTLQRSLSELVERGLIEESRVEKAYRVSRRGRLFVRAVEALIETVESTYRVASFLDQFPRSIPVAVEESGGCRVTAAEPCEPYAPFSRLESLLSDASRISMFTPVVGLPVAQMITTRLEQACEIDILVKEAGLKSLRSDRLETLQAIHRSEAATFRLVAGGPDFGTLLLDESAVLISYNESGQVSSILESSDSEFRDWAETTYREQELRAEPWNGVEG